MNDQQSRPDYQAGTSLSVADCALEQRYRLDRLRRHDRQLHGAGVVCGLWVVPAGEPARPWAVRVCPGYAVGVHGDEMQVGAAVVVDLREFLWAQPLAGFASGRRRPIIYVAIRAVDRLDRLVAVPGPACGGCADPEYRESRIGDGYEISGIWTPPAPVPPAPDLCDTLPACPACPDSPWLVLARIALPAASQAITAAMIDNGIRRTL